MVRRLAPGLISKTKKVACGLCSVKHGSYIKLIFEVKIAGGGKLFVVKRGGHVEGEATESVTMTNICINQERWSVCVKEVDKNNEIFVRYGS